MQPVSMLMSNLNVEAQTHHAPNALAVAQDTGQRQEIVQEGIRVVQRVQATDKMQEAQRVHRKTENDEREGREGQGRNNSGDSFIHTEQKKHEDNENEPLMRENVKSKKSFDFLA